MKTVTAQSGQTLLDIALQEAGTIEAAFELAVQNGMSITDSLIPGTEVIAEPKTINSVVKEYFQNNSLRPVSLTPQTWAERKGIGSMAIGRDFIVS